MESKNIFMVDNLITSLRSAVDATKVAMNIIKYFDLDNDVEDDETNEGMEIVAMLKSAPVTSNNNTMQMGLPSPNRRLTMSKRQQSTTD
ncbi:unnamed protein product [Sphagnum balticum]